MPDNNMNLDPYTQSMMNPYLMQDPNFLYNLMMQQQMMDMQMPQGGNPDPKMMMNSYMGNMQGMQYPQQDFTLNDMNSQFYKGMQGQGMNPQDMQQMNYNYMDQNDPYQNLNYSGGQFMGDTPKKN